MFFPECGSLTKGPASKSTSNLVNAKKQNKDIREIVHEAKAKESHGQIRAFRIDKSKKKQIKNSQILTVTVYNNKKMKGVLYPNTISNKVKFDEDKELGIFPYTENETNCWLIDHKGFALNLKNFIHVKDLQKENYKVSLILQYEEDRNLTNAVISMSTSVSKNNIPKEKYISIENTSIKRDITISEKNIYDLTNRDIEEHLSIPKSNIHLEIKSIEIIDATIDCRNLCRDFGTWLDKAVLEFTLPNKPFAEGGMRKAYMVYTTNMIDDLYMLSSHIRMLIKIVNFIGCGKYFTDPQVHTNYQSNHFQYGSKNLQTAGIDAFFKNP
ncbi:hypothetical protein RhiirC2_782476 [Rhizophagus irregularis]|uniref:Alpha-type protein kinase domain-containing protein n=1 Tax=Rhizophagus irregularis TaxID=588596 RepID=A0A2N1N2Z3_9GLOM|nr:hypothetical protein RhiirC2_782476 [Rhizophagus irregularis]